MKKNKNVENDQEDILIKEEEVKLMTDKINELEDKLLRSNAELINYRRRKDEEISRMMKYANEDIIMELIPQIDNFERAICLDDNDLSDEVSKFLNGFKIMYAEFIRILNNYGVKEIEAKGLEFNPTYHQAVVTEHNESIPGGVILEVLQKGYIYKDRVIRPSMVKVSE